MCQNGSDLGHTVVFQNIKKMLSFLKKVKGRLYFLSFVPDDNLISSRIRPGPNIIHINVQSMFLLLQFSKVWFMLVSLYYLKQMSVLDKDLSILAGMFYTVTAQTDVVEIYIKNNFPVSLLTSLLQNNLNFWHQTSNSQRVRLTQL